MNKTLQREKIANSDLYDVDVALDLYNEYNPDKAITKMSPEPKLSDFYTPSEYQKHGEYIIITLGMTLVSFLAYKFI